MNHVSMISIPETADLPKLREGMRILVVGASGGIGRKVLHFLSFSPVKVGAHYHRGFNVLKDAIGSFEGPAQYTPLPADIADPSAAEGLIEAFVDSVGGIDALVQLNGGMIAADPAEVTPQQWKADLDLNLSTPFFLAREAMKRMLGGDGRIVLTGTASAAHGGGRTTMAYGVAKAGIECLAKGLAREGASRNILVNAVCPGFIETPLHTTRKNALQMQERAALVPLKRTGTPEEVAGLIVFLLSRHASYITGQCIAVSGGDWL